MSELLPCPGCARHVRTCESTCPFCAQALSFPCVPKRVLPGKRLNRAALFALGAGVAGATNFASCVVPVYGSPGGDGGESSWPTPSPNEDGGAGGQGGQSLRDEESPDESAGDRNAAVYGGPPGGDGNF